ncbi:DinB family protein [Paenibacillus sp. HGF5]|uniref:DinB family protein n=1 Tax=Paenibacillus sp. HGF5 TaxID=908341 RepID=UPI0002071C7E|nr:DinB family protein [Paenibacillus sp. HGF5]EGG38174.1 conserved domain protein [Paenibacillus sp. HGF5]
MDHEFNRKWLEDKFENIRSRILKALVQLNDEQVNWRPNHSSLSISTLIRHIEGNIQERVMKGILQQDVAPRNREQELTQVFVSRDDLIQIVKNRFQFLIDTVKSMSSEDFEQVQLVRGKERSNLDILHQCATHYSEHMGQIFYIAKQCLTVQYKTTSI